MKVTRLYTGKDGESHFEDMDIPLKKGASQDLRSEIMKATGIFFRETGSDYDLNWHVAPRRQYIIILTGKVEIEVAGGTKRQFGHGDVILVEDTTGRGHISRAVKNKPRTSVFIPID